LLFLLSVRYSAGLTLWPLLTTATTTKTMEVKYFKVKHKVLKILSDFEKVSLKMAGKAIIISKWEKILLGKYPSHPGKTKIPKSIF
jgi:hypothetical protein